MTLDRLLRCALPAVVASFCACGSEGPAPALGGAVSQPCRSDVDCKGERVCVDGYCKSPASSGEGPCGNSPLTGKYLWETGCGIGMEKPFVSDCTGELLLSGSPEGVEVITGHSFTYNGLTLLFPEGEFTEDEGTIHQFELKRSFSRSDLGTGICAVHNNRYDAYQCVLEHFEFYELYVLAIDGDVCLESPYIVRDQPWPKNRQLCRSELRSAYDVAAINARCPLPPE